MATRFYARRSMLAAILILFSSCGESIETVRFTPAVGSTRIVDISSSVSSPMPLVPNISQTSSDDESLELLVESIDPSGVVTLKVTILSMRSEKTGLKELLNLVPAELKQNLGQKDPRWHKG